jgi:hypothetical protein
VILLTLSLVLFVVKLLQYPKEIGFATRWLNSIAFILIALNSTGIAWNSFQNAKFRVRPVSLARGPAGVHPDIYYLILDGYGRADVLREIYGYDNSEFMGFLKERGFFVASEARANYCQTVLSLSSSLNLSYIDQMLPGLSPAATSRNPLIQLIRKSQVQGFLESLGYTTIAFSSGYSETELRNADIHVSPVNYLSEFQNLILNMTPLSLLVARSEHSSFFALHRSRVLSTFERLADMRTPQGPCYVFAHIMTPHPPFVFGENGEAITPSTFPSYSDGTHSHRLNKKETDQYIEGYRKQIIFITKKIEGTIDAILARAGEKPIIIIQADHGPGAYLDWKSAEMTNHRERLSILNAYYFPDSDYRGLYEQVTPVNSFRIVFNHFFQTDHAILEDHSYYSRWCQPFQFHNVDLSTLPTFPSGSQIGR